jgi:hypothetical protein
VTHYLVFLILVLVLVLCFFYFNLFFSQTTHLDVLLQESGTVCFCFSGFVLLWPGVVGGAHIYLFISSRLTSVSHEGYVDKKYMHAKAKN